MEKERTGNSKFGAFMKKNFYFVLMIVCVIAIVTMVAVTYATRQHKSDAAVNAGTQNGTQEGTGENQQTSTDETEILFELPLEGETVGVFANDTLVYNSTLNQWSTHEAFDVAAAAGTEVKCIYDGTVTSISTSVLRGTEVVITHGNGMRSVYSLLDSDVKVTLNQKVKKGDVIGKIAESGTFERHKGAHLHLELYNEAGTAINPEEYFPADNK